MTPTAMPGTVMPATATSGTAMPGTAMDAPTNPINETRKPMYVSIDNLSKTIKGKPVLRNINAEFDHGRI